jgi:hypothetical protein
MKATGRLSRFTQIRMTSSMKKPTLRATKWLGDIPVEAYCTACPAIVFRAQASGHRPSREEYQASLQKQFDEHHKAIHSHD